MKRWNRCPACDNAAVEQAIAADDERRARFLDFSRLKYGGLMNRWLECMVLVVDRCRACGHHWYREQPDAVDLQTMYEAARPLLLVASTPQRDPSAYMLREMRRLRKLVGGTTPNLLDYGSGFGRWARAGVAEGFSVTAFEPSAMRGGENCETDFSLIHEHDTLQGQQFDVINLEQVLEHVPDPLATLMEIRNLCKPESVVRITVPNILRPLEGEKLWEEWPFNGRLPHSLAPFEHLHGFTPRSLETVVRRAGLLPVRGLKVCIIYPIEQMRRFLDMFTPVLGQTCMLAKVSTAKYLR